MWFQLASRVHHRVGVVALVLATSAPHAASMQAPVPPRGVVVEEVGAGSAGEKAGITSGDVLLSFVRAAAPPANAAEASGDIRSPFDFEAIELDRAMRGEVTLLVMRNGTPLSVAVSPGPWAVTVRPALVPPLLSTYEKGRALIAAKQTDEGVAAWRDAAALAGAAKDPELVAWLFVRIGDTLKGAARWDDARAAYQHALDALDGRTSQHAIVLARRLFSLGNLALDRRDLTAAEQLHTNAIAILNGVAPDSLDVAASLNSLGAAARNRGDLASAEDLQRRALAIRDRLAPDSLDVAASLNNLGVVSFERGDLADAEDLYRRALGIRERLAPGTLEVAAALNNLGGVAANRGNFTAAEDFYRRSVAIKEKLAPGSLSAAVSLNNLGGVAAMRGDVAAAHEFYTRALAIRYELAPGSLLVASTLNNLGVVARERRDLSAAKEFYERALAIGEKVAPDTLDVATTVNLLGILARERGDLALAENLHKRALAIRERFAPDSLEVAESHYTLGEVAEDRGDHAAAVDSYQKALSLQRKLAPGSTPEAEMLNRLASVARTTGQRQGAADYFASAIAALEAQTGRLGGGDEVRSGFAARYANYYREYVEVLVEIDQGATAFHVLERSRARSLLAMLAERDLVFAGDLPADLARERTLINAEYDRTQAEISGLSPARDAADIDRLLARLRELRDRREQIMQSIRTASPRFASLVYPQPLDLAGARGSLDPGTLLLAYSVGEETTFVFAVQPERVLVRDASPVSVFTVPIGEAALREKVTAFRRLINRGSDPTQGSAAPLITAGQELFDALIRPAQALIAASDRVLISPDGPLHTLPFAALVQPSARGPARYLIEWKPLHIVASATVYAELKRTRRNPDAAPAPVEVAAFGDPVYPPPAADAVERIANPEVRAALRRGYALEPLPASRKEVEAIARLYGARAVTYVGEQATEERAKAIGTGARYVHFASHGLLDERFPLNSALALTIHERPGEGQANGLLQAWEIFEQMRIDADLVTLSACETGLGKELGGEGLVGLTRAFQYAGARSVLASLWSVGDESTATLMTRFYGHLQGGRTKDQALRAAQLEMIRTRGSSHPFQWAAFQLAGDWR